MVLHIFRVSARESLKIISSETFVNWRKVADKAANVDDRLSFDALEHKSRDNKLLFLPRGTRFIAHLHASSCASLGSIHFKFEWRAVDVGEFATSCNKNSTFMRLKRKINRSYRTRKNVNLIFAMFVLPTLVNMRISLWYFQSTSHQMLDGIEHSFVFIVGVGVDDSSERVLIKAAKSPLTN